MSTASCTAPPLVRARSESGSEVFPVELCLSSSTLAPLEPPFKREPARRMPFPSGPRQRHILILYTGGTLGMRHDDVTGSYIPDTAFLQNELARGLLPNDPSMPAISFSAFNPPLDSSDMGQAHWQAIVQAIAQEHESKANYDGFVVLHGTDTMAFSASAASFALNHLHKPVVFTGAQIPLSVVRSDAMTNLVDACLLAAWAGPNQCCEVCLVFDSVVLRGNRITKLKAWGISGFKSFNYPILGEGGVKLIAFDDGRSMKASELPLECKPRFSSKVAIYSVHPGCERFARHTFKAMLEDGVRGIVIEAFGVGNVPSYPAILEPIREACDAGVVVAVVSRCPSGGVALGAYEGGGALAKAGCISGFDMTTEAAFAKLSWLLGDPALTVQEVKTLFSDDLRGEMTQGFLVHTNRNHRVLV